MTLFPRIRILNRTPEDLGYNGQNDAFGVRMPTEVQGGFSWIGVLAQEIWEFRYKWSILQLPSIFFTSVTRKMETISHEIEALCAERYDGFNLTAYEEQSADHLVRTYTKLFRGMTKEEALADMRGYRSRAQKWIDNNREMLDKWQERKKSGNL